MKRGQGRQRLLSLCIYSAILALLLHLAAAVLMHLDIDHATRNRGNDDPLLKSSVAAMKKQFQSDETCRHYIDHAANPHSRFLPAFESPPIDQPTPPKVPEHIMFLHYNAALENPKYLCSIESAARQNPAHTVTVYASNSEGFEKSIAKWRSLLPSKINSRIKTEELNWLNCMLGTPLASWFQQGAWKAQKYVEQNLGNAFRLGMLWQNGGVYFDLDIISINPVSAMDRAIVMQDNKSMNNAFFSLAKYDLFTWRMMEEFVNSYNGNLWGHNGPRMVTRTFEKVCKRDIPDKACSGLSVGPFYRMFPVQYEQRSTLYDSYDTQCLNARYLAEDSIGLHFWNKRTQFTPMSNQTLLSVIMKLACPAVFEAFSEDELQISGDGVIGSGAYRKVEVPIFKMEKAAGKAIKSVEK